MTRQEQLLTIAMEECAEVQQRLSKILRFGLLEVQPGQTQTNLDRLYEEFYDLRAVLGMCGFDVWTNTPASQTAEGTKIQKVERYLRYSAACGTLVEDV
jgi:hypothetical protein